MKLSVAVSFEMSTIYTLLTSGNELFINVTFIVSFFMARSINSGKITFKNPLYVNCVLYWSLSFSEVGNNCQLLTKLFQRCKIFKPRADMNCFTS